MIKNPVIVMALYDIGRDKWDNFTMPYDSYLLWMRNTLSLDSNIVIYTEQKFVDKITDYRKEFDPDLKKTIIVIQELQNLDCYKLYYASLCDLMGSDDFKRKIHHDVPEMTKPLYNIIMFNKSYWLKHTKDNKFFNNDLLIWADAGGLREDVSNYKNNAWPCLDKLNTLDNDKITFFSHHKDINVGHAEYHAMSQARYIQGTCFFVPSYLIDDFVKECDITISQCINNKFIGSDEKIFDLTYLKNPDSYHLVKCTWRTYFDLFKHGGSYVNEKNTKKIFVDMGGGTGSSVRRFRDHELLIDNSWQIHLFEPNALLNTAEKIKSIYGIKIKYYPQAIWINDGSLQLNRYGSDGTSGGSLVSETGEGKDYGDYYDTTTVECVDVARFLKSLDQTSEIYISMDIEFSEYTVLEYLVENWPKNIKKIWVEFHDKNKYSIKIDYLYNKIVNLGTEIFII